MYFSIFNIYEVKFCPVLHKNEEESSQQFADRIQKVSILISSMLGLEDQRNRLLPCYAVVVRPTPA